MQRSKFYILSPDRLRTLSIGNFTTYIRIEQFSPFSVHNFCHTSNIAQQVNLEIFLQSTFSDKQILFSCRLVRRRVSRQRLFLAVVVMMQLTLAVVRLSTFHVMTLHPDSASWSNPKKTVSVFLIPHVSNFGCGLYGHKQNIVYGKNSSTAPVLVKIKNSEKKYSL